MLKISNGTIYDGTGATSRIGDVLIEGDVIRKVGHCPEEVPAIDASGLAVAPGFIDIHSHSDFTLLIDPRAVSAVHQGVTTEIVGNCGFGCFPISDPRVASRAIYGYSPEVEVNWRTADEYFHTLEAARPAVNVASLVPHGQLRLSAVGEAGRSATTSAQRREMKRLLRQSVESGAWGLSTGLEYSYEQTATEEDIVALASDAPLYATHTRDRDGNALEAVEEALRTANRASVRLQISHLIPRSGADATSRCIEAVERAHQRGQDVAFDMHTRTFGTTNLHYALPPDVLSASDEQLAAILGSRAKRADLRNHRSIISSGGDWSRILLLPNPVWPEAGLRSFASLAEERQEDPLDLVYDLLLEGLGHFPELMVMILAYDVEQQREAFSNPLCVPGSDATTLAPDGPLAKSTFHGAYSWCAWFWRFAVRDEKLLTPEEAVHRLTGQPAERIGLPGRGLLREGAKADIVIFDPQSFTERATLSAPNTLATGVRYVFVNGVLTLADGQLTGERAGQVLRR